MKKALFIFIVVVLSVMTSISIIFFLDLLFIDKHSNKIKQYGSSEQKLYLLLVDQAFLIGQLDFSFKRGMKEQEIKNFDDLLKKIVFKRDCKLNSSIVVDGAMSCNVNGNRVDYIQYSDH